MVMGLVMVGAVETNSRQDPAGGHHPDRAPHRGAAVIVVPATRRTRPSTTSSTTSRPTARASSITGGSAGGTDHILAGLMRSRPQGVGHPTSSTTSRYSGGGESLAALLGNKVSAGISGVGEYAEQVKAGKLRALAVSGTPSAPALPGAPTAEGPGHRRRADQLARRGRPRAPSTTPEGEADRAWSPSCTAPRPGRPPWEERLGRRLPRRRRVRDFLDARTSPRSRPRSTEIGLVK